MKQTEITDTVKRFDIKIFYRHAMIGLTHKANSKRDVKKMLDDKYPGAKILELRVMS